MSGPALRTPDPERAPEPWLPGLARVGLYAGTAAVMSLPLSVLEGVLGATAGAAAGAALGRAVAGTRARTAAIVGASVLVALASDWLGDLVVGSAGLAAIVGPANALRLGEMLAWGLGAGALATATRALSARRRAFAILELALAAAAFGQLVMAHRNGAIHRPYELADPILERGGDPTLALLGVGAVAAVVVGLFLLGERSIVRWALHVGAILLVLLLALVTVDQFAMPSPDLASMGLTTRDDESRGEGGEGEPNDDGPEFRDEYDQSNSRQPVAIVLLHDDYSPPSGGYYFRQDAFSNYNGRRMVSSTLSGVDDDVSPGFPSVGAIDVANAPPTGRFRTAVETTVGLLADHPRPFGLESPIQLVAVSNPDRGRFRRTYRVRSASLTSDPWAALDRAAGDRSWPADVLAHYTRAPADPRYGELARRIVGDLPESLRDAPYAQALAITDYLGANGIYSLRSSHAGASDPTADFLFGDMTGYCVHFAHATVFLMRSIGLPSRVATGYMVAESARRGGSAILVAGGNSHAWPEIYLEGLGWVVVDVAPERALDPAPPEPDEALQQLLAELLRGETPLPADGSEAPRPLTEVFRDLRGLVSNAAVALVLLVLLAGYAVKAWRQLAPIVGGSGARPRLVYRAALDRLASAGVVRRPGESHEAFAERLARELPGLGTLTRVHAAAAFGGRAGAPDLSALGPAARELGGALSRRVPLRRRLLGALDPFSWVRTR